MVLPNQLWVTFSFENLLLGITDPPATNVQTEESHLMQGLDSKGGL